ncbi:GHKL domain-containing protein [Lacihabitans sp. CCS-44]|nr:GHKL domain-containing protein [Lacihabitans sp. CCS-44]
MKNTMQKILKGRRLEVLLVFVCFAIYVVRRLFQEASWFDNFIYGLQPRVPSNVMWLIWRELDHYSHFWNAMFPIAGGGFLFFVAWAVFHVGLFPKLRAAESSVSTLVYTVVTVLLVLGSVFVHNYFRLYYRAMSSNDPEVIVGIRVFSEFRKLFLLTDSIAVVIILVFYELFAQLYYYVEAKLKEEQEGGFIGHILVASMVVLLLFLAFFANLPRKDYWYGAVKELSMMAIGAFTVFFAQNFFYLEVLPNYRDYRSVAFKTGLLKFGLTLLVGTFGMYCILFIGWHSFQPVPFGWHAEWMVTMFMVFIIAAVVLAFLRKVFTKEKTQLKTQISQKTAELGNLRSQINPHFLFNALNTLYSVSLRENAAQTSDGIQKLGDMMRFMLHENHQDRIPLGKEIEYLNNFIDIQRMRIDENQDIKIEVNIQNADREIFIAPMLLNPFIENAFKHGISFRSSSWIYITLTHDAQHLYFKVHNSIHQKSDESLDDNSHGIGLENVKKRLELIYPNRHKLEIQATDHDYFVSLVLGVY